MSRNKITNVYAGMVRVGMFKSGTAVYTYFLHDKIVMYESKSCRAIDYQIPQHPANINEQVVGNIRLFVLVRC